MIISGTRLAVWAVGCLREFKRTKEEKREEESKIMPKSKHAELYIKSVCIDLGVSKTRCDEKEADLRDTADSTTYGSNFLIKI